MKKKLLVSIMFITYNQEKFVCEALDSLFAQTYDPLEIIVCDDCSPDRTFELIETKTSEYKGSHKIILNRNKENLGLAGNVNKAMELSSGYFLIFAAGDDISVPDRTTQLVEQWQSNDPTVDLVCSYFEEINENSEPTGFVKKEVLFLPDKQIPVRQWKCGATGACAGMSRKLYEKYGPLDPGVISEDWVFSFRACLESGLVCVEMPLVKHRTHASSLSVMYRDVKKIQDKSTRRLLRKNLGIGELARSREWLKAWIISGREADDHVGMQLQQWKKELEVEVSAFDSSRSQVIVLILKAMANGMSMRKIARLFVRHVLRVS